MNNAAPPVLAAKTIPGLKPINWRTALLFAAIAIGCFHAVYTPAVSGWFALLMLGYVISLVQLARLRTTRQSFYAGLAVGLGCFAPQLDCFWRIFGAAAIPLWLILACWTAASVVLTHLALVRLGPKRAVWLVPFLWTGLEYFRSELYYLKFSWLNVGYAFSDFMVVPFGLLGVYGVGFCVAAYAGLFLVGKVKYLIPAGIIAVIGGAILFLPSLDPKQRLDLQIAGVQLEFPDAARIQQALDQVIAAHTNVNLIVLGEYTLDDPPSDKLKQWCRDNGKFLIVGGKDPAPGGNYYNTAFVISTNGEVVFKQAKSVPIQFFKDGFPAPEQKVWDSPWGRIGICICYDLSYTRVTDELVRQGVQLLIVPTMDVVDWGRHQHELHARIAPVRAAEYGIPIFRLASSGISQAVSRNGGVVDRAPFGGDGATIFYSVQLDSRKGSRPPDRVLAPLSVLVTAGFVMWLAAGTVRRKPARAVESK